MAEATGVAPIVSVDHLTVHFPVGRGGALSRNHKVVHAVDDLSLEVLPGETLGLVGESGSGKTTTGRAILRRVPIASGSVSFKGEDITELKGDRLRRMRRHMQMVFQDPYGSLNPRMRVADIIAEPLVVHGVARSFDAARTKVIDLLRMTGLPADAADRFPHAFSGGQRQRIGIARALAIEPEFLVIDEPVAALDTSIQAQVVNLLQDLQDRLGLTYLLIAHDLSVVRHISRRVAIMYAGQLVELTDCDTVYSGALHPYTVALLAAVPIPDPQVESSRLHRAIVGELPDPTAPPAGCRFNSRCPYRRERCETEPPKLREVRAGHLVACHWVEDIEVERQREGSSVSIR